MDIIGFLFVLAAAGLAPYFGVDRLAREVLGRVSQEGKKVWTRLRVLYQVMAAKRVVRGLYAAAFFHAVLFLAAWKVLPFDIALPWNIGWSSAPFMVPVFAILVELALALRQRSAIAHYLVDENGDELVHPSYIVNEDGEAVDTSNTAVLVDGTYNVTLDAGGQLVIGNGAVTVGPHGHLIDPHGATIQEHGVPLTIQELRSNLVEHPFAGERQIDLARYNPGRLHTAWSFITVIAAFSLNAVALLVAGVNAAEHSRALILLAMTSAALALVPVKIVCLLAGWAIRKGIRGLEVVATFGLRQVLPLAAGITYENVREYVKEVDIADEGKLGNTVANAPNALILNVMALFLWVLAFPSPFTLGVVGTALLLATLAYGHLAANDGKNIVKNLVHRASYLQAMIVPVLGTLAVAWALFPDGVTKQTAAYRGELARGFFNGALGPDANTPWVNLGALTVGFLLFCFFGWIARSFAKKDAGTASKIVGTVIAVVFALPTVPVMGYAGYGLLANVFGAKQIKIPGGLPKPAPVVMAPAAPTGLTAVQKKDKKKPLTNEQRKTPVVHLEWTLASDNLTTGVEIWKKPERGVFQKLVGLGAATESDDPAVKPGMTYCYQVVALHSALEGGTGESPRTSEACVTLAEAPEADEAPADTGGGQPNTGNVQPPRTEVASNQKERAIGEYPDDL